MDVAEAHLNPSTDIRNVHADYHDARTIGQRAADAIAANVGAWRFVLIQSAVLIIWIVGNSIPWFPHWDAEPYILLNLMLSFQAAYTGPIVMMSQNRSAELDRRRATEDHKIIVHIASELDELREYTGTTMAEVSQLRQMLDASTVTHKECSCQAPSES